MDLHSEVLRVILIDLSKVMADSVIAENVLRRFLDDANRIADAVENELSRAVLCERSIADAQSANRLELDVWEHRAARAADERDSPLVKEAIRWKNMHDSVVTAMRDHHSLIQKEIQFWQHQMTALQAVATNAKAHLEVILARKRQAGIS